MDFDLTIEQKEIQKAAREFARGEFDPELVLECDRMQEFPLEVWKKACTLGFTGIHFPEEYGGQGFGVLENALIAEAFCRQDSGMGSALALSDLGAEMILSRGTEDQKKRILPAVCRGTSPMTLAWMEDGYAHGPFATVAERKDGGFVVKGRKSFVPFADLSRFLGVLCEGGRGGARGQDLLLIEGEREGKAVGARREKLGMRMVPMNDIAFESMRLPPEAVIGREGEGGLLLQELLEAARVECGAIGVGIAQGALDRAVEYSRKRVQFGRPIVAFEVIRNRLSDMFASVEAARHILHHAACSMDHGKPDRRLILLTKRAACEAAQSVANTALQIHGGYGYMTEGQIEHFYRDARALELFLEPSSIQRSLLAEEITSWRS
jgi:alkylation response protein AidB-like acyl-CoA dehydrogenase